MERSGITEKQRLLGVTSFIALAIWVLVQFAFTEPARTLAERQVWGFGAYFSILSFLLICGPLNLAIATFILRHAGARRFLLAAQRVFLPIVVMACATLMAGGGVRRFLSPDRGEMSVRAVLAEKKGSFYATVTGRILERPIEIERRNAVDMYVPLRDGESSFAPVGLLISGSQLDLYETGALGALDRPLIVRGLVEDTISAQDLSRLREYSGIDLAERVRVIRPRLRPDDRADLYASGVIMFAGLALAGYLMVRRRMEQPDEPRRF